MEQLIPRATAVTLPLKVEPDCTKSDVVSQLYVQVTPSPDNIAVRPPPFAAVPTQWPLSVAAVVPPPGAVEPPPPPPDPADPLLPAPPPPPLPATAPRP